VTKSPARLLLASLALMGLNACTELAPLPVERGGDPAPSEQPAGDEAGDALEGSAPEGDEAPVVEGDAEDDGVEPKEMSAIRYGSPLYPGELVLAGQPELWATYGLEVEHELFATADEAHQALLSGEVDVVSGPVSLAIAAFEAKPGDVVIFGVAHQRGGAVTIEGWEPIPELALMYTTKTCTGEHADEFDAFLAAHLDKGELIDREPAKAAAASTRSS
jgi:hypothetical protein